jgi:predicted Zn-dependent peptidase
MSLPRQRTGPAALLAGFLVLAAALHSQEGAEDSKSFVLDNGLKVFLYEKKTLPLLNFVFAVNMGSKDETEETSGLVHILEHYILFRGTKEHDGDEIALRMRRHGAYFNAHTGRDLASFEITIPSEHAGFALRNLKEILFELDFDADALEEEKQVILEELTQLQDDPFRLATSLLYQNLFPGHPYQRPIYGSREVIENATVEQLSRFYNGFLVPANSALAVVGDFSVPEMEEQVKSVFAGVSGREFAPPGFAKTGPLPKTIEIEREMDVQMAYLAIGLTGPDYNSDDQYALDVLTEIFRGGINPMIYHPLSRNRIQVGGVRMGYSAHRYGGAITIALALEPKHLKRAKRELTNYLKQARRLDYSSDDVFGENQLYAMDFMESAKNRLRFRGEQARERGLAIATSLARYMLLNEVADRGEYLDHIAEINTTDLRNAAGKYLGQKCSVIVTIEPKKKR